MATSTTRPFQLTGADGGPLRGHVTSAGGARPVVVLCHGFKGFKDWGFFPYLAERLARAGCATASFNFSGSGVSADGETFDEPERFAHNTYSQETRDLDIVLGALRDGRLGLEAQSYGLLGHSAGGGIAILRAATDKRVRALVTWAAVARFGRLLAPLSDELRRTGKSEVMNLRTRQALPLYRDIVDDLDRYGDTTLNVVRAARQVRAPWLIVHGTADESVPWGDARDLARAAPAAGADGAEGAGGAAGAGGAGEARELFLVDGAGHTFGAAHPWAGPNPALEQVVRRSVEWLGRHLV